MTYKQIERCRICGNQDLAPIIDLGTQTLTGVFPSSKDQAIASGPLELVKCAEDESGETCGLVQLRQTYDLEEMYGENYGYRSGLNPSMVNHLREKAAAVGMQVGVASGDLVIDIGSNDGTLLGFYPKDGVSLVGIDPTADKFRDHYSGQIQVVPEFFSAKRVRDLFGSRKAKVITSIAMFYDLEDPLDFMGQVYEVLADDGVWVFEQSYMPTMLDVNAYDTICHEHLEYYRLKQIHWMAQRVGFKVIDVEFNSTNGGSFSVVAAKAGSSVPANIELVDRLLRDEEARGLGTMRPYERFARHVYRHRGELRELIEQIRSDGETIIGYGASTKGNVVLQFCGLTEKEIPFVAEVNEDKFGHYTPGTLIPIIPEAEARALKPDYLLVMPWHFKKFFIEKEREYLRSGGKLVFPLPSLDVCAEATERVDVDA